MTGNNILLDTNIIIDVFGGNKGYADKISKLNGLYISPTVLGELYVGVYRVENKAKHLKKLHDFLKLCTVMEINTDTADYYGRISAGLFKKGRPIPSNDIWIAASVMQYNLTLISNDNHFKEIDGLTWEEW